MLHQVNCRHEERLPALPRSELSPDSALVLSTRLALAAAAQSFLGGLLCGWRNPFFASAAPWVSAPQVTWNQSMLSLSGLVDSVRVKATLGPYQPRTLVPLNPIAGAD
jgi:hypothetical protein